MKSTNSTVAPVRGTRMKSFINNIDLLFFCIPGIIITFIYSYIPIYGVQIAFKTYSARKGVWGSAWVGWDNFTRFFNSPDAGQIIWNTFILAAYSLIASFPIPIILALFLNSFRHKRYRKIIQTITYAPNFISVVVMSGMIILFLSPSMGVVNHLLGAFGVGPINFMAEASLWRHIYVWSGVWQTTGWSSVIFFAALAGVSPEYHEAAIVDGASKLQRIIHIDLPSLYPIITMMLIMNCGSLFSVSFEKALALQNPLNTQVSQIISTYVYKAGMIDNNISFSTAIGLFNSAVNAVLLLAVNWISNKISGNGLF